MKKVFFRSHGKPVIIQDNNDDYIINYIEQNKTFYEKELLDEIFHRAMPNWFFVDIGAHIGNHSIFLSKILGLSGLAFEARHETYVSLLANLEGNAVSDLVRCLECAVGDRTGSAISLGPKVHGNSGTNSVKLNTREGISQIAIDSFIFERLDFMKIDVEGAELNCLQGARSTIIKHKPLLCLEAMDRSSFEQLSSWLEELGYVPKRRFNATPTYLFEPI